MDAINGYINGEPPLNGEPPMNVEIPMNGHNNGHTAPVAEVPAPANGHAAVEPEITRIRGPLGLGSASLAGKVALVTGSGM
jgi:tetrahydroxynaphthalene reductase